MTQQPERLRTAEAAKYLNLSRSTLAKWRMKGRLPPYHMCGPRLVVYYRSELDAWERDQDAIRANKRRGLS